MKMQIIIVATLLSSFAPLCADARNNEDSNTNRDRKPPILDPSTPFFWENPNGKPSSGEESSPGMIKIFRERHNGNLTEGSKQPL